MHKTINCITFLTKRLLNYFISEKGQLDRFKEKIQKDTEKKQREALDDQLKIQQEEMNRLITEHKVNIPMVCKHMY